MTLSAEESMQIELSGTPFMDANLNHSMMRGDKDTFSYLPERGLKLSVRYTTNCGNILLLAANPQIASGGQQSLDLWPGDIAAGLKPCLAAISNTNTAHCNWATQ